MKHLFLDTNILIDFLADRKPHSTEAAKIFNYSLHKKVRLYVAAVSINNIYYILRQSLTHSATIKVLHELTEWAEIIAVTDDNIKKSLSSDFKDFEDAIQYHCAKSNSKMDSIVTRNTKDFRHSSISVMTPIEALILIERL
jgi:predicted nucleic acid-binding protein